MHFAVFDPFPLNAILVSYGILHSCSCIIEFIKLVGNLLNSLGKIEKMLGKASFNTIIHEHSCKILYICFSILFSRLTVDQCGESRGHIQSLVR